LPLNPDSKYLGRRAYVVKVRSDALPDALAGRLENFATGQSCELKVKRGMRRRSRLHLSLPLPWRLHTESVLRSRRHVAHELFRRTTIRAPSPARSVGILASTDALSGNEQPALKPVLAGAFGV
jgi:hypothetical protein